MDKPNKTEAKPVATVKTRYEVKLVSASGKELLRFKTEPLSDGTGYKSFGFHGTIGPDGKRHAGKGRGVTQKHADFASGRTAVDAAIKRALELGWQRVPKRAPGVRPDAFDLKTIPVPSK